MLAHPQMLLAVRLGLMLMGMPQSLTSVKKFIATDPREIPAYALSEAAHYLSMPKATLRTWVVGRGYPSKSGRKWFHKLIHLPASGSDLLSFFNLCEAQVLRAFRTQHGVELEAIRRALRYVQRQFHWQRPLIEADFRTDGVSLFFERLGNTIDASAGGQMTLRTVMETHLNRLEWNEQGVVARLYPFTRANATNDAPRSVVIDPLFSFGRPILRGSHIALALIVERYKAGDSIEDLANDYGCSRLEIEEGIRCELGFQTAA